MKKKTVSLLFQWEMYSPSKYQTKKDVFGRIFILQKLQ